jgi:L-lactate dehydrogenase
VTQRVAIVGAGAVGQACAFALMLRGSAREIVLIDGSAKRAAGVATDMRYGLPLSPTLAVNAGDWSELAGATVVLICAGVNEKSAGAPNRDDGRGRSRRLEANAAIYCELVPRIVAAAPDAVLLTVSEPADPLADLTRVLAGHDRVLSTGTTIDTLRLRVHVAEELDIHPCAVDGWVVGEHGTTGVMLWSSLRVAGVPLAEALDGNGRRGSAGEVRQRVERAARCSNITIIEGNDASQFGIAVACARITEAILRDERVLLPVAAYREAFGVTIALPTVVGQQGATNELQPSMSDEERGAFEHSAATLRDAAGGLGVRSGAADRA